MIQPDRNQRPAINPIGSLILGPATIVSLPNGITLHIVNNGPNEVCRLGIALPGGTAESPRPGLYDTVATLLPEGSMETPGEEMASVLETNGAWCGSSITTHHTLVNLYSLCSAFTTLLPLARQMAFSPAFADDAIRRTLQLQSSRTAVNLCKVAYRASKALKPLIYGPTSPLAILPMPDDILSFTREEIANAHYRRLDPSKIHIFLAGKITPAMVEAVSLEFGSIAGGSAFDLATLSFPEAVAPGEVVTEMPDALQSCVKIAIPTPGRSHPDFLKMRIAACALGGYFGSRLMTNIREDKGLTYGINASLYGYPDRGFLIVSTETDCANTGAVITETVSEIERLKDLSSYSPDETSRLASYMLSSLAAVLDSPFQRMDFLQNPVLAGTPADYYAQQYAAIRTITPDSIAETARTYFDTTRIVTSIAGKPMGR